MFPKSEGEVDEAAVRDEGLICLKVSVCPAEILHNINDLRELRVVRFHGFFVDSDDGCANFRGACYTGERVLEDEDIFMCADPITCISEHHDFILVSVVVVDDVVHVEPFVQMECLDEELDVLNDGSCGDGAGDFVLFQIVEEFVGTRNKFRPARNITDGLAVEFLLAERVIF